MKVFWNRLIITSLAFSAGFSCDTKDDPDTLSRSKLSPPLKLVTVTGSQAIELRWSAQNFESELQGYHVFMIADKTLEDLENDTNNLPKYPNLQYDSAKLAEASVPRCEDNNPFYALFGVTAESSASCGEGGILGLRASDHEGHSAQLQNQNALKTTYLLQEEEKPSILDAKLKCFDPDNKDIELGNENVSLLKSSSEYADGEGTQRCLIKQTNDGAPLENGKTYIFMVVAVLGSDFDEVSWSSNLVEDTPAEDHEQEISLNEKNYIAWTLATDTIDNAPTLGTQTTCISGSSSLNLCRVGQTNNLAGGDANTIYFARDGASTAYPQRLFVSSLQGGNLKLLYRGPITFDPVKGPDTIAQRVPEDQAITNGVPPYVNGATIPIYGNSVIDISYTVSGSTYYGKLIIDQLNYGETSASTVTFKATIVMQRKAGSTHYWKTF